ncbi:MAG: OmpA family protein [Elusimicrobiota bacterium]
MKNLLFILLAAVLMTGCVSMPKYKMKVDEAAKYQAEANDLTVKIGNLQADYDKLSAEKAVLEKQLSDLQADNKKLTDTMSASNSEKNQTISDLTKTKQSLEGNIRDLNQQITAKNAEIDNLNNHLDALKKEKEEALASMKNSYDNLVMGLQSEITQGEIQITQLEGKLTVNMVDKVLFDSGKAEVSKQGRATLDRIGAILKKIIDKQIRVEGHTDNVLISRELQDKYPTNWELSTARATNVARYLIDKAGVDKKFVAVSGYADTKPVDTNTTPEGKAKNRRIEIVLVPLENPAVNPSMNK